MVRFNPFFLVAIMKVLSEKQTACVSVRFGLQRAETWRVIAHPNLRLKRFVVNSIIKYYGTYIYLRKLQNKLSFIIGRFYFLKNIQVFLSSKKKIEFYFVKFKESVLCWRLSLRCCRWVFYYQKSSWIEPKWQKLYLGHWQYFGMIFVVKFWWQMISYCQTI